MIQAQYAGNDPKRPTYQEAKELWPTPRAGNPGSRKPGTGGEGIGRGSEKENVANTQKQRTGYVSEDKREEGGEIDASNDPGRTGREHDKPADREVVAHTHPAGRGKHGGAFTIQEKQPPFEPDCGETRNHWSVEPCMGRVANGVPGRVDRLKQLGNAVVPQVVEIIGRAIMESETSKVGKEADRVHK